MRAHRQAVWLGETSSSATKESAFAARISAKFILRATAKLREVKAALKKHGIKASSIDDETMDEYRVGMRVDGPGGRVMDVSISIAEAQAYGGDGDGINVSANALWAEEGKLCAGYNPYNYTGDVWTTDEAEFWRRLDAFDAVGFAEAITDCMGRAR